MGRVVFNGNVATPESQAYIRQEEQRLLAGPGDEFAKARRVEMLYRDNGLIPGTFLRAGASETSSGSSGGGGTVRSVLGGILAFLLILFAVAWMNDFGHHTPEQDAQWAKIKAERAKNGR